MNRTFANYVTSTAFQLSLSKLQIEVLLAIEQQQVNPPGIGGHFVMQSRGLGRRGLVTYTDPSDMSPPWSRFPYQLTDAGKLVCELLRLAGLDARHNAKLGEAA